MVTEILNYINITFDKSIQNGSHENMDVWIDCLDNPELELVLEIRNEFVRIGVTEKDSNLGDMGNFDFTFYNIDDVKRFLFKVKLTGKVD